MALARHDTLCRSLRTVEKGVGSVSGLLPFNANRLLLDGDVYQFGVFEGSSSPGSCAFTTTHERGCGGLTPFLGCHQRSRTRLQL